MFVRNVLSLQSIQCLLRYFSLTVRSGGLIDGHCHLQKQVAFMAKQFCKITKIIFFVVICRTLVQSQCSTCHRSALQYPPTFICMTASHVLIEAAGGTL